MKSSNDSFVRSVRLTRRTATVTMSAPEAACARAISCKLRYFPVPTISRERNPRPAITNSSLISILPRPLYRAPAGQHRLQYLRAILVSPSVAPAFRRACASSRHKLSPCIEPFDHFRVTLVNHAPLEFESISQLSAIKREVVIEHRKPLDRLVLRQSRIDPANLFANEVMDPGISGKLFVRAKRASLLARGGLDVRKIGHNKS